MANVTPGYTFTGTTDPITYTKLNLVGQPTVTIGSSEITTSMLASGNTYAAPTLSGGVTITQSTPLYETYSTVTFGSSINLSFTTSDGNTRRIACTSSTASTITATAPRAGYKLILSFTTDGTAGNVITFSTGFKTTGTYTLGSANKYYNIAFISDGTNLLELHRTAAVG
jgi:hypothetical protein